MDLIYKWIYLFKQKIKHDKVEKYCQQLTSLIKCSPKHTHNATSDGQQWKKWTQSNSKQAEILQLTQQPHRNQNYEMNDDDDDNALKIHYKKTLKSIYRNLLARGRNNLCVGQVLDKIKY